MDPVTGISLGRIVIGICALVAPDLTARMFGVSAAANPQAAYLTRLFGARETALGAVTLVSRGSTRRNLTLVGMAVDGTDAATGVIELRSKRLGLAAGAGLVAVAGFAVLSGARGLAGGRKAAKGA
ncbi:MAG: hypothetical protein FWE71_03265 [Nocardioidaceae bacterium]|nr:hypothetical protein [Nocardioidaceae bacterium]MCL2612161.1 hypothetical protein [Nocardioidaceae bacterium]